MTEKHVITKGQEKEEVLYLSYTRLDEQGNWLEAHTYNRNHLPVEILVREIEYWSPDAEPVAFTAIVLQRMP